MSAFTAIKLNQHNTDEIFLQKQRTSCSNISLFSFEQNAGKKTCDKPCMIGGASWGRFVSSVCNFAEIGVGFIQFFLHENQNRRIKHCLKILCCLNDLFPIRCLLSSALCRAPLFNFHIICPFANLHNLLWLNAPS